MRTAAVAAGAIGVVAVGTAAWFMERPRAASADNAPVAAAAAAPAMLASAATDAPDAQSERLIVYKTPT